MTRPEIARLAMVCFGAEHHWRLHVSDVDRGFDLHVARRSEPGDTARYIRLTLPHTASEEAWREHMLALRENLT